MRFEDLIVIGVVFYVVVCGDAHFVPRHRVIETRTAIDNHKVVLHSVIGSTGDDAVAAIVDRNKISNNIVISNDIVHQPNTSCHENGSRCRQSVDPASIRLGNRTAYD